jgi:hypothetical protein
MPVMKAAHWFRVEARGILGSHTGRVAWVLDFMWDETVLPACLLPVEKGQELSRCGRARSRPWQLGS